jgi:uncharacterized zinc-type alcohol dehydrogenase-like protein
LLCAGITTWSPLRHWQAGPGRRVGIVGIGGLGHMGIKLARALGAHVTGFTTSADKRQAILDLGAHQVIVSSDKAAMTAEVEKRLAESNEILRTTEPDRHSANESADVGSVSGLY